MLLVSVQNDVERRFRKLIPRQFAFEGACGALRTAEVCPEETWTFPPNTTSRPSLGTADSHSSPAIRGGGFATPILFLEKDLRDQTPERDGRSVDGVVVIAKVNVVPVKRSLPLIAVDDFGQRQFIGLQHRIFADLK